MKKKTDEQKTKGFTVKINKSQMSMRWVCWAMGDGHDGQPHVFFRDFGDFALKRQAELLDSLMYIIYTHK